MAANPQHSSMDTSTKQKKAKCSVTKYKICRALDMGSCTTHTHADFVKYMHGLLHSHKLEKMQDLLYGNDGVIAYANTLTRTRQFFLLHNTFNIQSCSTKTHCKPKTLIRLSRVVLFCLLCYGKTITPKTIRVTTKSHSIGHKLRRFNIQDSLSRLC